MNDKEKYLHKILDAVVESCSYIDCPEAKVYVDEHNFVYEEPKYEE